MGGELVVAHQAGHLLDQIHRPLQIEGPGGWHGHEPAVLFRLQAAAQGCEGGLDPPILKVAGFAIDQHRTQQVVQPVTIETHRWAGSLGALMQPAAHHAGASKLLQQRHGPVCGCEGGLPGQTLLETAAGLRAQAHAAGRAPHRLGSEHGRLEPEAGGRVAHRLRITAHHAGDGDRPVGVGHQQGFRIKAAFLAIEAAKVLAPVALAQAEGAGIGRAGASQGITVEGVQRLAGFQHHQVGDIHHVVDGSHTGALQPPLQPGGRAGDLHPLKGGDAEETTGLDRRAGFRRHLQRCGIDGSGNLVEAGAATGQGRHLPGDALHREPIGPVGGDRQIQNLIIETEAGRHRCARRRHTLQQVIQNGDATGAIGQSKLLKRADHAAAGHTAQLGRLDREVHGRQMAAHKSHGHVNAGTHVGGTADDLQGFRCTHIHHADAQFLSVGMGIAHPHNPHHHTGGPGAQVVDLLHLETGDREPLSQLGRVVQQRHCAGGGLQLHKLTEPLERYPHR